MQLAMIGLGRMGGNMAERLMRHGHELVAFDRTPTPSRSTRSSARRAAKDLADSRSSSSRAPRVIWIMVPAGDPVDETIAALCPSSRQGRHHHRRRQLELSRHHPPRRASSQRTGSSSSTPARAAASGDWRTATVSWSAAATTAVKHCEPIFTALAPADGYAHVGPTGAGPLREDGAQRHRVRPAAGVRRGI